MMAVPSREVVASWKRLVDCSPTALVATRGAQHQIVYLNPAFQQFCGKAKAALRDQPLDTALPPVHADRIRTLLDRVHASGEIGTEADVELPAAQGEPTYWSYTARALRDPQGNVEGLLVQVADTTDQALLRRHHEQLLAQMRTISQALLLSNLRAQEAVEAAELAEQRVRKLLAGLDATIWVADATMGRFSFVSEQARDLLGYPLERWYTDPEFWPSILHPDYRDKILTLCREQAQEAEDFDFECQVLTADGRSVWLQSFVRVTPGSAPEAPQLCGVTVEITAQKLLAKQLERQAFSDGLTALPNRTLFLERLQHAMQRRERHGKEVAVFFLDLDGFKRVNDALGHAAGDELLQEVSRRLLSGLRDEDTLARFGGDEFALLIEDETNTTDTIRVAQRLLTQLLVPFVIQRREVIISASIGIAVSSPTASRTEALLRNADEALYRAKAAGKGQWVVFDQTMQTAAVQRLQLETDLFHAEARGQLRVHYQSEVDLETGEIMGVEALLRWEHPKQGLLLPVEFLPVAEELGLILPMGRWLRREAVHQIRQWNVGRSRPLTLSVNLCAREFQDPNLPEEIQGLLDSAASPPGLLRLELTETTLLENVELAAQRITSLQQPGVEFALDDFGTGYSSLGYLRQLPVQVLKIDRSFIRDLAVDGTSRAILRSLSELGKALQMQLTAEGIETLAQHEAVQQTTCARGQGYYFSRPVDAEGMSRLLA
jgi:diguanylate cyclase (GGDEF)-like protein/PAS domain S-box-containing protein